MRVFRSLDESDQCATPQPAINNRVVNARAYARPLDGKSGMLTTFGGMSYIIDMGTGTASGSRKDQATFELFDSCLLAPQQLFAHLSPASVASIYMYHRTTSSTSSSSSCCFLC